MVSRYRGVPALYAFLLLGAVLLVVPWTSLWREVTLALLPRQAAPWVLSGWVRGAVSGLGALDLLVAAQVARELWSGLSAGPDDRDSTR